tara:strand:+ start:38725 stop:39171 length:447 start_codon:yes stop_codon:yes gene_type:complete
MKVSKNDLGFHHIGIVSKDMEIGKRYLENSLGVEQWSEVMKDINQKVSIMFGRIDGSNFFYELLVPLNDKSPIFNSLKKGINIVNHVAYSLKNFDKNIEVIRELGSIQLTKPSPAVAFKGAKIVFFMNKLGFITEFIEDDQKINLMEL